MFTVTAFERKKLKSTPLSGNQIIIAYRLLLKETKYT